MANSVDSDQTAPIGAVCSGSTLFACILKFASNVWQLFAAIGAICSGSTLFACILIFASNVWQFFAADDFRKRHFQMHFFFAL